MVLAMVETVVMLQWAEALLKLLVGLMCWLVVVALVPVNAWW